jgi:cobaltochelatase CobT
MAGPGDNTRGKPKAANDGEVMKRAISVCMRAIDLRRPDAGTSDLRQGQAGDWRRQPGAPPRDWQEPRRPEAHRNDIAVTRGLGDSMALRRACHDTAMHSRLAPEGKQARAVFDAVEQARVEAIGARAMHRRRPTTSRYMLEDKYPRPISPGDRPRRRAARGGGRLMVREKLTGRPYRRSGAKRRRRCGATFIEDKAGQNLDGLLDRLDDQNAFARRRARDAGGHGNGRGDSATTSARTTARPRTRKSRKARKAARTAARRIPAAQDSQPERRDRCRRR